MSRGITATDADRILSYIKQNQPVTINSLLTVLGYANPPSVLMELESYTKLIYENDDNTLGVLDNGEL
jgi:hypothetical protein